MSYNIFNTYALFYNPNSYNNLISIRLFNVLYNYRYFKKKNIYKG